MNKKLKYGFVFVICLFFVFVLTGCSSGGQTYAELESKLKDSQLDALKTEVRNYVDAEKLGLSEEEQTENEEQEQQEISQLSEEKEENGIRFKFCTYKRK